MLIKFLSGQRCIGRLTGNIIKRDLHCIIILLTAPIFYFLYIYICFAGGVKLWDEGETVPNFHAVDTPVSSCQVKPCQAYSHVLIVLYRAPTIFLMHTPCMDI